MNTINKDTGFLVIDYLDNVSIKNIISTNKFCNNLTSNKNIMKVINRNNIIRIWGLNIYNNFLKNKSDLEKYENINVNNFLNIMEIFYIKMINQEINFNVNLFIEVYNICYYMSNHLEYQYEKKKFFYHRLNIIKKCVKKTVTYDDIIINKILNVTNYFQRYCYINMDNFIFNSVNNTLTNNQVIDMINNV